MALSAKALLLPAPGMASLLSQMIVGVSFSILSYLLPSFLAKLHGIPDCLRRTLLYFTSFPIWFHCRSSYFHHLCLSICLLRTPVLDASKAGLYIFFNLFNFLLVLIFAGWVWFFGFQSVRFCPLGQGSYCSSFLLLLYRQCVPWFVCHWHAWQLCVTSALALWQPHLPAAPLLAYEEDLLLACLSEAWLYLFFLMESLLVSGSLGDSVLSSLWNLSFMLFISFLV